MSAMIFISRLKNKIRKVRDYDIFHQVVVHINFFTNKNKIGHEALTVNKVSHISKILFMPN